MVWLKRIEKIGGVTCALVWLNVLIGSAQNQFGNEWIRSGQTYLKFVTNQNRMYRVTYADIQSADSAFSKTNPQTWQLFFRGQPVAIRVIGQQDGALDPGDYLEFYGEANEGSQDSVLYRPQQRLHPYQTLFSDRTAYFLTNQPPTVGKRMVELALSANGLTPEPFHLEEVVQAFTSDYTFNNLKSIEPLVQQSYFEPGEGWSGPLLTADSVGMVSFSMAGRLATSWPVTLETMINGRDYADHRIQLTVNDQTTPVTTFTNVGFGSQTFQQALNPASVQTNQLRLRFTALKYGLFNFFSITYAKLTYPQRTAMTGLPTKVFHVPANPLGTALLAIENAPATALVYDITDKMNCRFLPTQVGDSQTRVVIDGTNQQRTLHVTAEFGSPLSIQSVHFTNRIPAATNYLILTHHSLLESATAYARYRASAPGGSYQPVVIEADSLYDQYNYGERSPLALRRFADYVLATTGVKNLLLIGRACSYPYYVKTTSDDLVPTIGYPGSDILLTAGLQGYPPNTPAIPTGRLNVTTNEQVLAYLDKVKQYENTVPNGLWRKQLIHISGGKTPVEAQNLYTDLTTVGTIFQNGLLGGQVNTISKSQFTQEVEPINLTPLVNNGVGMVTFFGHADPTKTDMDFGYATDLQHGFHNANYPLMVFNGCGVGEIFSRFTTLSTDWLLAPQKGAALVLAHSYLSYRVPTLRYLIKLYSTLFSNPDKLGLAFGQIQQDLNLAEEQEGIDPYDLSVILQMVLQGDPALHVFPLTKPDYSVGSDGLYVESAVRGSSIQTSDSLRLVIPLANLGKYEANKTISLLLTRTFASKTTTSQLQLGAFRYQDTLTYMLAKDESLQKIDVLIDPAYQLDELTRGNNFASFVLNWAQANAGSSFPASALPDRISPTLTVFIDGMIKENDAVVGKYPQISASLVDQNALDASDTNAVCIYLKACQTCPSQRIAAHSLQQSTPLVNQLVAMTDLSLTEGKTYELTVIGKDAAGNQTQPPYHLNLSVANQDGPVRLVAYPNPASSYVKFDLSVNSLDVPQAVQLHIYNEKGISVYEKALSPVTGLNSYSWQPTTPGVYPYTMRLIWRGGTAQVLSGKITYHP